MMTTKTAMAVAKKLKKWEKEIFAYKYQTSGVFAEMSKPDWYCIGWACDSLLKSKKEVA